MKTEQIGRLAFRHEGTLWVAYYALKETMDGALFLGSIRMAAVVNNPARRAAFMDMMRGLVADVLEEKTGQRPVWKEPVSAPEHERGGKA